MTNTADLQERASYILSSSQRNNADGVSKDAYDLSKTPTELEDGAIVGGGALHLWSREALGLFSQYGAIGVLYGMLPVLSLPIYTVYLNMEGYQTASYGVLVTVGWTFKVFWGMLSDCVPIFGYRRKSWMLIGWFTTMVCLAVMTFLPIGEPYCDRRVPNNVCKTPLINISEADKAKYLNFDAPGRGSTFIILSMFISFGYVIAACASDAMVVQYAQREPEAIRGRVQTAIYTVRTLTGVFAQLVVAFLLNGKEYGGSFTFSVPPNAVYGICLAPCIVVVFTTIFVVVEDKSPRTSFTSWRQQFWGLLQKRVMWQICAFRFINTMFQSMSATPTSPIASKWAQRWATSSTPSFSSSWGLNWNWRWTIAFASLGMVAIDSFVMFMTIWNVYRNQWFYTGVTMADNIPMSVRFIVSTYCAVEIADVGNEGATYGLITTVGNLASPVASVIYKYIDSFFDVSQNDILTDSTHVRWEATYVYIISYSCKVLALGWLFLLPPQKVQMQELKRKGGSSKIAGALLVLCFLASMVFSMTSSIMAIYPSTKCYRIAGGKGTVNGTCPK
ncbi:Folate-Biopterin Transporter (FBT) Family [Achlya hypogyna]|uniref:Folate-Biopterin Transporter (FBT) Family n=1 Tax=Achlya hypogyna TaxID=1202772 RepID=A0A1V9ZP27_ACHHY|nr:Folate-Biopterin Transporter (FBT) Family [Achlya hypogyna]